MNSIYLTKKEKKKIDTIIQRGQKVGKRVDTIIENINKQKEIKRCAFHKGSHRFIMNKRLFVIFLLFDVK